jgi:hypothetical protein
MLTAIVGILLGNLLVAALFVPALRELQGILKGFSAIELPHRNVWPSAKNMTGEQLYEAKERAATEFNRLFREYSISFGTFKKVGTVFVAATIVLACVVIWQLHASAQLRVLLVALLVGAIISVGLFLQRTLAPTPSQLVSIDFLQNNFANLHLDSLFDCSGIHVAFGRKDLGDRVINFSIGQNLMFSGYRLLTVVSNPECSEMYFVAYGEVDGRVPFQHIWTPEVQMFSTLLGDFSLSDAMLASPLLRLSSWLFVPTPEGWEPQGAVHPRFLSQEITTDWVGTIDIVISPTRFAWRSVDETVGFERKSLLGFSSWVITGLTTPTANSPQSLLTMFKDQVEHCGRIKSQDYPGGIRVQARGEGATHNRRG